MKIKNFTILTILTIALFTGCGDKEKIDDNIIAEQKKEIQTVPTFNLKTTSGKDIKIIAGKEGWKFKGYENKVILLNFFGTWCPPCKAEIPHLENIRAKVKDDFEILAIDIGPRSGGVNSPKHMADFIKKYNISYPIVTGKGTSELFGAVSELNKNGSIPFMILFNKQGKYVQYYLGIKPEEMLFKDITSTIEMQ